MLFILWDDYFIAFQVRRIGKRIRDPDPPDSYHPHHVRGFDQVQWFPNYWLCRILLKIKIITIKRQNMSIMAIKSNCASQDAILWGHHLCWCSIRVNLSHVPGFEMHIGVVLAKNFLLQHFSMSKFPYSKLLGNLYVGYTYCCWCP